MFTKSQKFSQFRQSDLSSSTNRSRSAPGTVSRFLFFGDGDDSIDQARNISFRSSQFQDDGRVKNDDPDYYKFTLNRSGSVKFNVRNQGDDLIRFSIVDRRDRTISVSGNRLFADVDGDDKQKFSARLSSGTYFIRIETRSRSDERFDFTLKLKSNSTSR